MNNNHDQKNKETLRAFARQALEESPNDLEAARQSFLQKVRGDTNLTVFLFRPWIRPATQDYLSAEIRRINAERREKDHSHVAEKANGRPSEPHPERRGSAGNSSRALLPSLSRDEILEIKGKVHNTLARNLLNEFLVDGVAPKDVKRRRKPKQPVEKKDENNAGE